MKFFPDLPVSIPETERLTAELSITAKEYLICYFLSGSAGVSAGGTDILCGKDSFLLLPPGHFATVTPNPDTAIFSFEISKSFVQDHLDLISLPVTGSEFDRNRDTRNLKRLILDVAGQLQNEPEKHALAVNGTLYLLLDELSRLPHQSPASREERKFSERVAEIAEYISLHFSEALTLTELARVFYLTPQYLSTFFRKNFGKNFKNYLNERRLFYSLRDLRHTKLTISEIALKNGFSSISAYRRNFQKAYGKTPSEYRSEFLNESTEKEIAPDPHSARESYTPDSAVSSGRNEMLRQSVELQADNETSLHADVHRMINIGSVQNLLSENFRNRLTDFAEKSGISHIRMQGLLSGTFIPMVLPHYEYYFRHADTVLAFLYEHNLTPCIELSRLPARISAGQEFYIPRGSRFMKLLESLLLHITRRWPVSWLRDWIFELWMLPRDTASSYAKDFRKIRSMITSFIPGARLGGSGWDRSTAQYEPEDILSALRAENTEMDFFSVSLSFAEKTDDTGLVSISLNENLLRDTALAVKQKISSYHLPLYVTEWTSANLPDVPAACSRYQAAFIAKNYLVLDSLCDLAAYWLFCDTRQDARNPEGTAPAIFGNGLMSSGFLPYAPLYAWQFSSGLGKEVVAEGDFYRMTKLGPDHYRVLAWHYEHFRSGTEAMVRDMTDFDRIYTLFRDAPASDLHFLITGLSGGLYHVSRFLLGEYSGSLLDILIGEYTHSNIDKIDFLQNIQVLSGYENSFRLRACVPEERSSYTEVEGSLEISAVMPAHTVCMWDIRRQK